ncbi:MAG: MFS transporter [bacterium]|jgi:MFS family permease
MTESGTPEELRIVLSATASGEGPARLLNKNFLLLWQGQFVSQFGTQLHAFAMMFWIKHATGSATLMGTIMMLSTLPGVILAPLGGTIADRISRKKIIVWGDLIAGISVLLLAVFLFYFPEKVDLSITFLGTVAVILGIISAIFNPAIGAAIPDIVPRERISAANSMRQSAAQTASLVGQGIGGVLYRVLGAPMLLLIDGISYIFSGVSCLFIKIPQKFPEKTKGLRETIRAFLHDLREGLRYVWQRKGLRDFILSATLINFFFAPMAALLPFHVEDHLHATPDWFGYMIASIGGGSLVGYAIAGTLKVSGAKRTRLFIAAMFGVGLMLFLFGLNRDRFLGVSIMALLGVTLGIINIFVASILQATTPTEIRGRVFGLLTTISGGLMPLGMGLAGVIADLTGQRIPLIFTVSGILVLLTVAALTRSKEFRIFIAFEKEETLIPDR